MTETNLQFCNHAEYKFYGRQGIELEAGDDLVIPILEDDTELGLLGSSTNLIRHPQTEKHSLHSSVKTSIKSSVKKVKSATWSVLKIFKKILLSLKLAIVVLIYSIIGALMFMQLEKQTDLDSKAAARDYHLIARGIFLNSLKLIEEEYDDLETRETHWNQSIEEFENNIGASLPEVETSWTFSMAILYAGTIYTTIGYGNIACVTTFGRIATIIYAMLGIPLMIIVLNSLNGIFLAKIRHATSAFNDAILYTGVRLGIKKLEQGSPDFVRYQNLLRRQSNRGTVADTDVEGQVNEIEEGVEEEEEETVEEEPPVLPSVIAAVGWIFLSAAIFCLWEDWTYFTSIYFFFVSLSTIGFGDITPGHPEYMIATFGVVIIGLALLGVCIDVVREKLEKMYLALLQKLLQEYIERAASGDHDGATKGMMSGFQNKTKYLMPFISKERGAKVMDRFKEKAKEQGIELPAVLTDIDPETGAPAFASAKTEEFSEFIEKAKVMEESLPTKVTMVQTDKDWQEIKKTDSITTGTQFSTQISREDLLAVDYILLKDVLLSIGPQCKHQGTETSALVFPIETQTEVFTDYLIANSFSVQASPEYFDNESQTSEAESTDSGIQVCDSMDDISTQMDTEWSERWTQYEGFEGFIKDVGIQNCKLVSNTGIQPEVSSLILLDYDNESEDEEEKESGFEVEEDVFDKNEEAFQDQQSISASTEKFEETEFVAKADQIKKADLSLAKVVKLEDTPLGTRVVESLQTTSPALKTPQITQSKKKKAEKSLEISKIKRKSESRRKSDTSSYFMQSRGNQTKLRLSAEETKREIQIMRQYLGEILGTENAVETERSGLAANIGTQVDLETTTETQTDICKLISLTKTDSSVQNSFQTGISCQTELLQSDAALQTVYVNAEKITQTELLGIHLLVDTLAQTDVSAFDLIFDRPTQTEVSAFDMLFERHTQTVFSMFGSVFEIPTQTEPFAFLNLTTCSSQTDLSNFALLSPEKSQEEELIEKVGDKNPITFKVIGIQATVACQEGETQSAPSVTIKTTQTDPKNSSTVLCQTESDITHKKVETLDLRDDCVAQTESIQKVTDAQISPTLTDSCTEMAMDTIDIFAQTDNRQITDVAGTESIVANKTAQTTQLMVETGTDSERKTFKNQSVEPETLATTSAAVMVDEYESEIEEKTAKQGVETDSQNWSILKQTQTDVSSLGSTSTEKQVNTDITQSSTAQTLLDYVSTATDYGYQQNLSEDKKLSLTTTDTFIQATSEVNDRCTSPHITNVVDDKVETERFASNTFVQAIKDSAEKGINAGYAITETETKTELSVNENFTQTVEVKSSTAAETVGIAAVEKEIATEQPKLFSTFAQTNVAPEKIAFSEKETETENAFAQGEKAFVEIAVDPIVIETVESETETERSTTHSFIQAIQPTKNSETETAISTSHTATETDFTVLASTVSTQTPSNKNTKTTTSKLVEVSNHKAETDEEIAKAAIQAAPLLEDFGVETDILITTDCETETTYSAHSIGVQATTIMDSRSINHNRTEKLDKFVETDLRSLMTASQTNDDLAEIQKSDHHMQTDNLVIAENVTNIILNSESKECQTIINTATSDANCHIELQSFICQTETSDVSTAVSCQPLMSSSLSQTEVITESVGQSTTLDDMSTGQSFQLQTETLSALSTAQTELENIDSGVQTQAEMKTKKLQTAVTSVIIGQSMKEEDDLPNMMRRKKESLVSISKAAAEALVIPKTTDSPAVVENMKKVVKVGMKALSHSLKTNLASQSDTVRKKISDERIGKSPIEEKDLLNYEAPEKISALEKGKVAEDDLENAFASSPNDDSMSVAGNNDSVTELNNRTSTSFKILQLSKFCSAETDTSSDTPESVTLNVHFLKTERVDHTEEDEYSTADSLSSVSSFSDDVTLFSWNSGAQTALTMFDTKNTEAQFRFDDINYVNDAESQSGASSFEMKKLQETQEYISFLRSDSTQTSTTSFYKRPEGNVKMISKALDENESSSVEFNYFEDSNSDDEKEITEDGIAYKADSGSQAVCTATECSSQTEIEKPSSSVETEFIGFERGIQCKPSLKNQQIGNVISTRNEAVQPSVSTIFRKEETTEPMIPPSSNLYNVAEDFLYMTDTETTSLDLIINSNTYTQTDIETTDIGNQATPNMAVKEMQCEQNAKDNTAQTENPELIARGIQFDEAEYQLARRAYMIDVGIQMGVLTRVQHIFSQSSFDEEPSQKSVLNAYRANLRLKTASTSESDPSGPKRTLSSSEISTRLLSPPHQLEKRISADSFDFKYHNVDVSAQNPLNVEQEFEMLHSAKKKQTVADLRSRFSGGEKADENEEEKRQLKKKDDSKK